MRPVVRFGVLPMLLSALLVSTVSSAAFADDLAADGDGIAPVASNTLAFGTVCSGSTTTKSVLLAVKRNGSGNSVYANGASVVVSVSAVTGAGVSAAMAADATIGLPSNWSGATNNSMSADTAAATVTLIAGSAGPLNAASVSFDGTTSTLTKTDKMNVTATITNCDSTPPVLALPANITREATNAAGATVTYTATATDTNPANPAVTCSPASGSTFAIGTTTVSCSATDAVGNTASGSFTITVRDTTPPTVTPPSALTVEATGPSGAVVTYASASATDLVDGAMSATCVPASGATFALGSTTVTCSATDAHANTGSAGFTVTVQDTTDPVLILPADITAEATGTTGAAVPFSTSASDLVDGSLTVDCDADSGDTFPLGPTTVHCSAADLSGNSTTGDFSITVVDTTPPIVTPPADATAEATGPTGAVVSYPGASAADLVDGAVSVSCAPASGSTFSLGTTTVTCSATDAHGNTGSATFSVSVIDTTPPALTLPADQLLEATSAAGAVAAFAATAEDLVDGPLSVDCDAESGDVFPLGTTTVHCSVEDAAGNAASGSFTIEVEDTTPPETAIESGPTGWITVDHATFDVSGSDLVTASGDLVFSHRVDDGAWSAFDGDTSIEVAGLSEGPHTFEVVARDEADNPDASPASRTFSVDTIAPAIVPGDVIDTTWRNTPLSQLFTASDGGSGLAENAALDASGQFTLMASTESAGASTPTVDSLTVSDIAGNSTTRTLSALIDLTDPTISAVLDRAPAATGWFNAATGAPSVEYDCGDTPSGLAVDSDCPDHVFGEGANQSHSTTVYDLAGNSATAGVSDVDVDVTAPALHVSAAAGGSLELCGGTPSRPSFAPTDGTSGIASSSDAWTTPSGGSGVGTYTYTAQAADVAGNTGSDARTYTIQYGAAFGGVLQPINADGTSRFKLGSTIPVKFRLTCNGVAVSTAVATLTVKIGDTTPDPGIDEAISTAASTTGNLFRYSDGQYIFNLSTKQGYLNPGATTPTAFSIGTWTLGIHLDDGTSRTVRIQLAK